MSPSKPISIPRNPSARRGKPALSWPSTPLATTDDHAPKPVARPAAAAARATPAHRFHVGERLRMTHGGNIIARQGGGCKVVSLLPYEGYGPMLYRVRSETESFERIVAEADLTRG